MNHTSDHARAQHTQCCTCHWPPSQYPQLGFGLDPDCPKHGTDACLALADPELDIDTSYRKERT